ncbi:hypothetical protein [Limnohabitans sp.]|uniref:hypothetical protein n=1 Tax=Limnohabitans sp. TaxID=1907725 RepID=UPI00286F5D23|nr:hypothetical protein [Limnohabitans sp.]
MSISPFFQELRSAYQAELDDLNSDSEGHYILDKRLTEKRKELGFLLQMMDLNPEMVAVVLHQAFEFHEPELMAHFITRDADDLLSWDALSEGVRIAPWAQPMVEQILAEPVGAWFMTVAAALEYMHGTPMRGGAQSNAADADEDLQNVERGDQAGQDDDSEEREAREREEAGNAWMVEQGFDSKE